jgi:small conductance mechanosensitive channel
VRIGPDQDVAAAVELLTDVAAQVAADETIAPMLLSDPEVSAFEDLTGESVMLRVLAKTAPAKQWDVQRELRGRIRAAFLQRGMPLALPRREVLVERPVAHDQSSTT